MRILTNMNSLKTLDIMRKQKQYSQSEIKRSSSGKLISASDNESGVVFSTRLESKIRGLEVGIQNSNDAISMLQTYKAAFDSLSGILSKMKDIASQAATTVTPQTFSDEFTDDSLSTYTDAYGFVWEDVGKVIKYEVDVIGEVEGGITQDLGYDRNTQTAIRFGFTNDNEGDIGAFLSLQDRNNWTRAVASNINQKLYIQKMVDGVFTRSYVDATIITGQTYELKAEDIGNGQFQAILEDENNNILHVAEAEGWEDAVTTGQQGFYATSDTARVVVDNWRAKGEIHTMEMDIDRNALEAEYQKLLDEFTHITSTTSYNGKNLLYGNSATDFKNIKVQLSDNADDDLDITLRTINENSLGSFAIIAGPDGTAAQEELKKMESAINYVSGLRSEAEVYVNRLNSNIENNASKMINPLSSAMSRIMDAEIAMELAEGTKNNIIKNSAAAILSQSNQNPEMILSLL